jgi:hypothetical protein
MMLSCKLFISRDLQGAIDLAGKVELDDVNARHMNVLHEYHDEHEYGLISIGDFVIQGYGWRTSQCAHDVFYKIVIRIIAGRITLLYSMPM